MVASKLPVGCSTIYRFCFWFLDSFFRNGWMEWILLAQTRNVGAATKIPTAEYHCLASIWKLGNRRSSEGLCSFKPSKGTNLFFLIILAGDIEMNPAPWFQCHLCKKILQGIRQDRWMWGLWKALSCIMRQTWRWWTLRIGIRQWILVLCKLQSWLVYAAYMWSLPIGVNLPIWRLPLRPPDDVAKIPIFMISDFLFLPKAKTCFPITTDACFI